MSSKDRQKKILQMLEESKQPVSASALAEKLQVSRQIIVGDVALLRAKGIDILATPKGYIISSHMIKEGMIFKVACQHRDENVEQELYTIVDNGGTLVDVIVEHPVYGQLLGQLNIASRYDADEFLNKVKSEKASLLSRLTDGVHLHTIACKDQETLDRIMNALKENGILFSMKEEQ